MYPPIKTPENSLLTIFALSNGTGNFGPVIRIHHKLLKNSKALFGYYNVPYLQVSPSNTSTESNRSEVEPVLL